MPACATQNDPCLKQNKTQQTVQGLCVFEPSSSHLSCPQARKQAAPANLPMPGECCQGTWPHALETLSGASTVQFTPLCDLHPGASKQTKAHTGGVTGSRSQQEGDFSKVVLPPGHHLPFQPLFGNCMLEPGTYLLLLWVGLGGS